MIQIIQIIQIVQIRQEAKMFNKFKKIKNQLRHYLYLQGLKMSPYHYSDLKNTKPYDYELLSQNIPLNNKALAKLSQSMNHLLIKPKEAFSFWNSLKDDDLSQVKNADLCLLSDSLFYLFLNAPFKIIERHGHSLIKYPDFKNSLKGIDTLVIKDRLDLKVKNNADYPIEIKIKIQENNLHIGLYTWKKPTLTYQIINRNLDYTDINHEQFETVDIYRQTLTSEKVLYEEKLYTNVSRSIYGL